MSLPTTNIKAFFVTSLLGLSLTASESSPTVITLAIPGAEAAEPPPRTAPAPVEPSAAPSPPPGPCGEDMILVDGDACPDAEEICTKWIDPPPYANLRCETYVKPSKCKGARVHKRFCVDREEYTDKGEPLPTVNKSWNEAQTLCGARGARLCKEAEWEFACEGVDMSPYPYGWKRDSSICNFDKTNLGGTEEKLNDLRAPITAYPDCLSPFGVHDMVGNVDEWTEREGVNPPYRGSLRGGWWLPGRNRCRAATREHGEDYSGKQVGFRCCKEVPATTE